MENHTHWTFIELSRFLKSNCYSLLCFCFIICSAYERLVRFFFFTVFKNSSLRRNENLCNVFLCCFFAFCLDIFPTRVGLWPHWCSTSTAEMKPFKCGELDISFVFFCATLIKEIFYHCSLQCPDMSVYIF